MTHVRTRKTGTYVSLRRIRRQHKITIAAMAAVNGVSFDQQLTAMLWAVLKV